MTVAEKLTRIAENQQTVYDAGKNAGEYGEGYQAGIQAEYHRFWDAYQENGARSAYDYAFYGPYWTDQLYIPKYPVIGRIQNAFRSPELTSTKVPIVATGNASNAFLNCGIKTIPSLDMSGVSNTSAMFGGCTKLQNITMVGTVNKSVSFADSSKLTNASAQSVIDALADLTGATQQTLTFHPDVGGELTNAQETAVTAKNWILVY